MRARAAIPLALTILGFAGIGGLWIRRVALCDGVDRPIAAVAGAIYAAWIFWESRVSVRELSKSDTRHDRGTMEIAAVAKLAFLVAALAVGDAPPHTAIGVAGLILLALGALLRGAAIQRLGPRYSHRIRPLDGPVVDRGPYAIVRHPAYLGTLVAHTGLALVFFGPWALAGLLALWWPAVVLRTRVEDRLLLESPDYRAYAGSVRARLVPGLW